MGTVIFIIIAIIIGLMISGKRASDKKKDHLLGTLNKMDENLVHLIGIRSLGFNSSTSKEQIITFIDKKWNYLKSIERDHIILDVMIADANSAGNEIKAQRLMAEKLKLTGGAPKFYGEESSSHINDVLVKFEEGLRTLALKTIRENSENPMVGTITLNLMGDFRMAFENEVMSKKRELDFDEEVVRNAIENIYTKIYEEVFEIK
ncbi:hypothetical protein [Anaerophaga thermohalophila]|jgi:hypothetical protein|uniref:hypothetical protein n=1 Tax=Anaerophaga thermohalophila TaxID=177400 RepID=UPI0002F1882D|nr:hypothetical protein [Anaerophaga thermohalophila]